MMCPNLGKTGMANVAVSNLRKVIADRAVSIKDIKAAIAPLLEIYWAPKVVRRVGSSRLNETVRSLRSAKINPEIYAQLAKLYKDALTIVGARYPA